MHALGLEHEFRLVNKNSGGYISEKNFVGKLDSFAEDSLYWMSAGEHSSGAWLLDIKNAYENINESIYSWILNKLTRYEELMKIEYFYYLLEKIKWNSLDKDGFYFATLNGEPVEVKYLYLFLCRTYFPPLEEISVGHEDLFLISDPGFEIRYLHVDDPLIALDHEIKIRKSKKKIMVRKLPRINFNLNSAKLFLLYNSNEENANIIPKNISAENFSRFMLDFDNSIIEDEYQNLIEIKNIENINVKVKDVIELHKRVIDDLLIVAEGFLDFPVDIPIGQYMKNENIYTGSYHVWFTLPKISGMSRYLANYYSVLLLQWVEPLLFSFGMDDVDYKCKSTFRMCGNNKYSGFGSTDPKSLLGKTKTFREILKEGYRFIGETKNNQIYVRDDDLDGPVINFKGNKVMFVEDSPRISTFLLGEVNKTYLDYVEEYSGQIIGDKTIGNDVRFLSNYNRGNHSITKIDDRLVYLYRKTNGTTVKGLSEEEELKTRRNAFEVRIFDNSSLELMEYKIESMILIFRHAIKTKPVTDWCFSDEDWHNAMGQSLVYGHSTVLNSNYLNKINFLFDTDIPVSYSLDSFFEELVEILHGRYKKSEMYKAFFK